METESSDVLRDSPGYGSLTTFTLKRAEFADNPSGPVGPDTPSDLEISSLPSPFEIDDFASITRSLKLKQRPWIVYDQFHNEKEPDVKQRDMSLSPKLCLPKGVTRGCLECSRCQKVSARWDPEGACTYALEDAIVLHPNDEDFKDPFEYIKSIRKQVEPYGMCRIVPPSSWKSPSYFEEDEIWQSYKISTQVQRVNELQNHGSYREAPPDNDTREAKRRRIDYEFGDASAANFTSDECHGSEIFQIESGPDFSLIAFKRYADDFLQCYFSRDNGEIRSNKHQELLESSEKNIEGEYWRIVEKPTEEIEVLYGSDANSLKLGSNSPVSSNSGQASDYVEGCASNWDLINLYKLPASLLSFETLDSGLLAPKFHIGMCFSSLPWTVEEHRLYKLQYLHLGAPRIWYSIPGCDSHKFEAIAKKHLPDSTKEHIKLLHRPGRQISPATLTSEGIPVYRCIQRPGEFVVFLPGAYHSGFDCGFNCSASVVVAPLDWLPDGQISMELYRENRRKTSISYDKVLLRAADEVVKDRWESLLRGKKTLRLLTWKEASGKDGALTKSLRERVRLEARCREYLSSESQARKMDQSFDGSKLECSVCCYDLYMSAVSCNCSRTKYSCLVHAKHFCSCPWSKRTFFFRFQLSELNILAEAVEGKLSAARTWINENLGLALHWDKANEDKNGSLMDPLSTSVKDKVPAEKVEASGSKLLQSQAKEPLLETNLSVSKAKAGEISLKGADDDTSSSSSDFDVEEYVTRLEETFNSGAFSSISNKIVESMPNEQDRV